MRGRWLNAFLQASDGKTVNGTVNRMACCSGNKISKAGIHGFMSKSGGECLNKEAVSNYLYSVLINLVSRQCKNLFFLLEVVRTSAMKPSCCVSKVARIREN